MTEKVIIARGNENLKNQEVVFKVTPFIIFVERHGSESHFLTNRSYSFKPTLGRDFQSNKNFMSKWVNNLVDSSEKWALLHIIKKARLANPKLKL